METRARRTGGLVSAACFAVRLLCLIVTCAPAAAETLRFGPFSVESSYPGVIKLDGTLDGGSALAFRRTLNAAPDAKLIVLNSDGGLVQMGLLIADDVFQRKIATLVPAGSHCYSACSFIFLAGGERRADGELGVHQITSDLPDLASAQLSISDIIDTLNRFGTPVDVLTIMFRTPSDQMYVFSTEEVAKFQINRTAPPAPASGNVQVAGSAPQASPIPGVSPATPPLAPEVPTITPSQPSASIGQSANSQLSAIEDYARLPTRLAIFSGLDFAGQDIRSEAVVDAAACATMCVASGGACKAFTFNIKTSGKRGPNCFLKSGRGQADGNAATISGQFLSRIDTNPLPFTLGVIDPGSDVAENVDLVGADLSSRPSLRGRTARDFRLACVGTSSCAAFTYIKSKRECWMKSSLGQPRYAAGMISGAKRTMTVQPSNIIDLQ